MSTTNIFNKWRSPKYFLNKFVRDISSIWDANLHHGDIRPFACPELICTGSGNLNTLFPLEECDCAGSLNVTDIVQGFCHQQILLLHGGILNQVTRNEYCSGGVGIRAGAFFPGRPSVSAGCGGCDATGVSYVVTSVVSYAGIEVESAPSPASHIVASGGDIPNANVTWPATAPYGTFRIYRVETTFEDGDTSISEDGSEWVFVAQVSGTNTFHDNIPSSQTGAPLSTHQPMAFPAPENLVGLCRTLDGIAVADSHRVYISIPGQYQFTYDGVVEVEDTIRAIRAINNTIFVFTDKFPVKIAYHHTDLIMSVDKQVIRRHLPLLSKKSVSVYGSKVWFSTTHSLYTWDIGGYGDDIKSTLIPLFTPEQWKNFNPETVRGTAYEFGYIFSSDSIDHSVMIEIGQDGTDTLNDTSAVPISYINADTFGLDNDGHILYQEHGNIYRWDFRRNACESPFDETDNLAKKMCDTCTCCPWKVELFIDNEGKNHYSDMRIEWDERSATHLSLTIFQCRFGKKSAPVASNLKVVSSRGFKLPRRCSSQTFCIEIHGCGIMHEVRVATSSQELVYNSNNMIQQ